MQQNNTGKTVEVHIWQGSRPHISLEIKTNDRSSSYYFSYVSTPEEKFVDALSTDKRDFGNKTTLTFNALCIDDILERYRRFQRYAQDNNGSLGSLSSVDFVDELLVKGGLKELSNFYVSTPTLVQSFVLLIAGSLLLLVDNDIAIAGGLLIFFLGVRPWVQSCCLRISCDCFKKRTLNVAEYCSQRLLPAHALDAKRIKPLLKNRNKLDRSLGLCVAALTLAGVFLLALPGGFILDRKTAMVSGVVAIVAGYMLACACCQFYCVKSTPSERRLEKKPSQVELSLSGKGTNRQPPPESREPLLTIFSLK